MYWLFVIEGWLDEGGNGCVIVFVIGVVVWW